MTITQNTLVGRRRGQVYFQGGVVFGWDPHASYDESSAAPQHFAETHSLTVGCGREPVQWRWPPGRCPQRPGGDAGRAQPAGTLPAL